MSYTAQNKVLPGVYSNFTVAPLRANLSDRGRVALPTTLSWGEPGKVLEVTADNVQTLLGYRLAAPEMLAVRLILHGANTVLVYRLNEGVKASGTIGALTVEAAWGGVRGNDIAVKVAKDGANYLVSTLLSGEVVDTQVISTLEDYRFNGWAVLKGEGAITVGTASLTGGADGSTPSGAMDIALAAYLLHDVDVITSTDMSTTAKNKLVAFSEQAMLEDRPVQCVVVDMAPDNENVLSVRQSLVDKDGTEWTPPMVCAWLAGATAGAKMTQSNTNALVDAAADVKPRYTKSMQEQAVLQGQCVFDVDSSGVRLVYDINTRVTANEQKPKSLRKNKILRVLYTVDRDIKTIIRQEFLGKVPNSTDGRGRVAGRIAEYLMDVQHQGAIEDFDASTDLQVQPGKDVDAILVDYSIQPVDTGDKYYITAEVR